MPKFYAGIGSRQTPPDICDFMTDIAAELEKFDWTLRSGHAGGADLAFENGATKQAEIMLPWSGFNGARVDNIRFYAPNNPRSLEIAAQFHPAWDRCSQGAKNMHARNVHQIAGLSLNEPVKFVVCWTPNGSRSGGTGQALRIAEHLRIPIFDLALDDAFERLKAFVA